MKAEEPGPHVPSGANATDVGRAVGPLIHPIMMVGMTSKAQWLAAAPHVQHQDLADQVVADHPGSADPLTPAVSTAYYVAGGVLVLGALVAGLLLRKVAASDAEPTRAAA